MMSEIEASRLEALAPLGILNIGQYACFQLITEMFLIATLLSGTVSLGEEVLPGAHTERGEGDICLS